MEYTPRDLPCQRIRDGFRRASPVDPARCWPFLPYARIAAMEDLKYWVALSLIPQLGAARFRRLEFYFGDMEHAWRAGHSELRNAGLDSRTVLEVVAGRERLDPDGVMEPLNRAGVKVTNWNCDDYPPRLKEISEWTAGFVLHRRDNPQKTNAQSPLLGHATRLPTGVRPPPRTQPGFGIVGNHRGQRAWRVGIDGVAHQAALDSGGRTIAVVASGLDLGLS